MQYVYTFDLMLLPEKTVFVLNTHHSVYLYSLSLQGWQINLHFATNL